MEPYYNREREMNRSSDETKAVFVLGENHFRKYFSVNVGVWLYMENSISGNAFQLTVCWDVKWFPFLFYLQISFSGKQRESWVRGRWRPRAERERERETKKRPNLETDSDEPRKPKTKLVRQAMPKPICQTQKTHSSNPENSFNRTISDPHRVDRTISDLHRADRTTG